MGVRDRNEVVRGSIEEERVFGDRVEERIVNGVVGLGSRGNVE